MTVDISILISTRNRLSSLEPQFEAFSRMRTSGLTFEILVVDNGSTDGTYEWLKGMASRLPVTALREPEPGKNRALNRALPHARGELIVFTDDDTIPAPDWLRAYHEALARWPDEEIFCGPVEPLFPPGTPDFLRYPAFRYGNIAYVYFLPKQGEGRIDWLPVGPNFAVRSRTLRLHRFNEDIGPTNNAKYSMGSETELLLRLMPGGEKAIYLPEAKVLHSVREEQLTIKWLMGRAFRFGRTLIRLELGPSFERNWRRDTRSPRLFGAPIYLWREMLKKGVKSGIHRALRMPQRWESAFAYKMLQGQIYEYRSMRAGG